MLRISCGNPEAPPWSANTPIVVTTRNANATGTPSAITKTTPPRISESDVSQVKARSPSQVPGRKALRWQRLPPWHLTRRPRLDLAHVAFADSRRCRLRDGTRRAGGIRVSGGHDDRRVRAPGRRFGIPAADPEHLQF